MKMNVSRNDKAMKKNVGTIDQWLRASLGLVLLILAGSEVIGPWGYIGVVPLLTAGFRWCPLYQLFGVSTCASRAKS